eukprot:g5224.t1
MADRELQLERIQALESENDDLRKQRKDAVDQLDSLAISVKELERGSEHNQEIQKHQSEVIAKLTADNLVQMIKLKEQNAMLMSYKADLEAMKQEMETKKTPWFEEIRSNIELRVKESFERSEELRTALETSQTEHEEQIKELNVKLNDASESMSLLENKVLDRDTEINNCKAEITRLLEERTELMNELASCRKRSNELEAQLKVSAEALIASREQCLKLWCQNAELQSNQSSTEATILDLKNISTNLEDRIMEMKHNLEKQIQANIELMKRKEAVEWELVEAKSTAQISHKQQNSPE